LAGVSLANSKKRKNKGGTVLKVILTTTLTEFTIGKYAHR